MLCSYCGKQINEGRICLKCNKIYCADHDECQICKTKLSVVSIENKEVYNNKVQWVKKDDVSVGLYNFEFPPMALFYTFEAKINFDYKIILFKNKRDEISFKEGGGALLNQNYWNYVPFYEKSRYSFFALPQIYSETYVFINTSVLDKYSYLFLIKFFNRLFYYIKNEFLKYDQNIAMKSLSKLPFIYNQKFGIPFVSIENESIENFESLLKSIINSYIEFKVLMDLMYEDEKIGVIDYIKYKIDMNIEFIKNRDIVTFRDAISIINFYFNLSSIRNITKKHNGIYNEIDIYLNSKSIEYIKHIKDHPDLKTIFLNIINDHESEINNYIDYIIKLSRVFIESVSLLEPKYTILEESVILTRLSNFYINGFRNGIYYNHEVIGDFDAFLKLLFNIYYNEDANVIMRIISAECIINSLVDYVHLFGSTTHFDKLVIFCKDYLKKADDLISRINKDEIIFSDPFHYGPHDVISKILIIVELNYYFNSLKMDPDINDQMEKYVEKHNLYPFKVILNWKTYLLTHEISYLEECLKYEYNIDYIKFDYIEDLLKIIFIYSKVMKYNSRNNDLIEDAISITNNMVVYDSPYFNKSQTNSIVFNGLFNIIKNIYYSLNKEDYSLIKKTKPHILSIYDSSAKNEPLKLLCYKTELLIALYDNDPKMAHAIINKVLQLSTSQNILIFSNQILTLIENVNTKKGRLFVINNINTINGDIWDEYVISFMNKLMNDDLTKNLVYYDYVYFVEGITDVKVFEEFKKKICPDMNILFYDTKGYTNLALLQKESLLLKLNYVKLKLIFDGDTKRNLKKLKIKRKLEKQYDIKPQNSITLNKNTIEDYILSPKAIMKAFNVKNFSEEYIKDLLEKKNNKKDSLNYLFRKIGLSKYSHIAAQKIAKEMGVDEVNDEIKNIFIT